MEKHVWVKCFHNSSSCYYNYKGYFSVILIAHADMDGLFTMTDLQEIVWNTDEAVFHSSCFGR
jgi:hypothetical protein